MNSALLAKIISISISSVVLIILSLKKPNLSGIFETLSLFGIFLFALFIPIKDGLAIFGMVFSIIFFVAYRIAKRDIALPKTPFNLPIIIYVFFVIFSFLFTYSLKNSINQGGEVVYFFVFFFLVSELMSSKPRIKFMLYTFTFSVSVAIIYGFLQGFLINAAHSANRVTGLIGNWDGFPVQASYGIMLFLAFYILSFSGVKPAGKTETAPAEYFSKLKTGNFFVFLRSAGFSLLILLGFVSIIFAKSRSAWIGLIAGIFTIMFLKSKKLFVYTLIAVIFINAASFYTSATFRSRVFAMFNPKVLNCESASHGDIESHIALIKSAAAVFLRFPFTGIGAGAFSSYFNSHKDVHFPFYTNRKTGKKYYDTYDNWPENGYMQTLSETGIFSFIALMWLFFLGIKEPFRLFKNSKDKWIRKISVMTAGISLVFYGSFLGISNMSNNELTDLWLFFLAIFASAVNLQKKYSLETVINRDGK